MRIRIRILDPNWKNWIQTRNRIRIQAMNITFRFTDFFYDSDFSNLSLFFISLIFMQKLDEPFKYQEIFIISLF